MIDMRQIHVSMGVRRHKDIPYLWKSRCSCGAYFLASEEWKAKAGLEDHISQEEPFPDMGLTDEPSQG